MKFTNGLFNRLLYLIFFFFVSISSIYASLDDSGERANLSTDGGQGAYASEQVTPHPEEHVDLFSGNLKLTYKDFSVKVSSNLEMSVVRTYSSGNYGGDVYLSYKNKRENNYVSQGWSYHQGYIKTQKHCDTGVSICNPVFVSSTQDEFVLLDNPQKPEKYKTKNNWVGSKENGSYLLIAPNGNKYYFAYYYELENSNRYYLTSIETVHGERINFTYDDIYIKTITSNNTNQVIRYEYSFHKFTKSYCFKQTKFMAAPSKVYYNDNLVADYRHDIFRDGSSNDGCRHILVLRNVILSNGKQWDYDYEFLDLTSKNGMAEANYFNEILTKVKDPSGSKRFYKYAPYEYWRLSNSVTSAVLSTISHQNIKGVESGHWDFKYKDENSKDNGLMRIVTVKNNKYSKVNRYYDYQSGSLWRSGLLIDSTIYKSTKISSDNIAQYEKNIWDKVLHNNKIYKFAIYGPNQVAGGRKYVSFPCIRLPREGGYCPESGYVNITDTGVKQDSATYRAVLKSSSVVRYNSNGVDRYKTEYTNFDDYDNPETIVQHSYNNDKKIIEQKYLNIADKNIIGLNIEQSINGKVVNHKDYDNNGNVIEENNLGKIVKYKYDDRGNLISVIDGLGNTNSLSDYKLGIARQISYSDNSIEYKTVDEQGHITSEQDRNGNTIHYNLDLFGRIIQSTPPIGESTNYSYPNSRKIISQNGAYTEEIDKSSYDLLIHKKLGSSREFFNIYDSLGRTVFQSQILDSAAADNESNGRYYDYDSLNRIIKECSDASLTDKCTFYDYLANNSTKITYPNGEYKILKYLAYGFPDNGKLVQIEEENRVTNISRDGLGYITNVKQGDAIKSYIYDDNYNLIKYIEPETGETNFKYDKIGNLLEVTKGDNTINSTYDGNNYRLIKRGYTDDSEPEEFKYDLNGNVVYAKKGRVIKNYSYDALNRLTKESLSIDKYKKFHNGSNSLSVSYEYNSIGHLNKIIYTDNTVIELDPNEYGEPKSVGSYVKNIKYHSNGVWKSATLGNNIKASTGLDSYSRLNEYNYGSLNLHYDFDKCNNLKNLKISDNNFNHEMSFDYDLLGRIIGAKGPWGFLRYDYNINDNLLKVYNGQNKIDLTYNDSLRLINVKDKNEKNNITENNYKYDKYGNVKTNNYYNYTYGIDGNLYKILGWYGHFYEYDENNNRVIDSKIKLLGYKDVITFYNKAGKALVEYDYENNKIVKYIYFGANKIAKEETSLGKNKDKKVYYFYNDAVGSPVAMSDESGKTLWHEIYTPFGAGVLTSKDNKYKNYFNKHWFAGKELDDTDLSYFGARYYDAKIGRFMSPDPVSVNPENPSSFNRYSYANNNPYKYNDPDGRNPVLILAGIGLLAYDGYSAYKSGGWSAAGKSIARGAGISVALGGAGKAISKGFSFAKNFIKARSVASVETPWGMAKQAADSASLAARKEVGNGATLYRTGTTGKSQTAEAQFWSMEHPSTTGFSQRHGIPTRNVENANFIEAATLKPGSPFVTRPAPGIGVNGGGGIEVVIPSGGARMNWFSFGGH